MQQQAACVQDALPSTALAVCRGIGKDFCDCRNGSAHLVKEGFQVLCANTMPRSNNAALEQREGGFNGVRFLVSGA
jgi:hypothetical protein